MKNITMRFNRIFSLILLTIVACDKQDSISGLTIDGFPMAIGNEWTYQRQVLRNHFNSEISNEVISTDTFTYTIHMVALRDTLIGDSILLTQFYTKQSYTNSPYYEYYYVDVQGLKRYGFSYDNDSSISKENPPSLVLKLPLTGTSKWVSVYPGSSSSIQVNREVIGSEDLLINNYTFHCLKIKTIRLNDAFNTYISMIDWIANEGLIKTEQITERMNVSMGEDTKNYAQITDTMILTGFGTK